MSNVSFLAPAFLTLALLALLVPLLHRREQRRDVRVPSLMLWRKLAAAKGQAASPSTQPLFTLPVALQMLALVLLALGLARPVFGPDAGAPRHKIFILDVSGSMNAADGAQTKFASAHARLAEALKSEIDPDGARISLIAAGPQSDILLARRKADHDLFAEIAQRLSPSDGAIDWHAAARFVGAVRRAGERDEIIFLSDGADLRPFRALVDAPLTEWRIGNPAPDASLEAHLASVDGSDKLRLSGRATFANGTTETTLDVSFRNEAAGVPLLLQRVVLKPPRGETTAPFSFDLSVVGEGVLTARLSQDANTADNVARFVVDANLRKTDVLIVGRSRQALLRTLQALPNANVEQRDTLPGDVARYALIVVVDTTVDRRPETNTLWIGEARLGNAPRPNAVEPGDITSWRADHPASRGIVWGNLGVTRASKFERWSEADLLLAAGDTPLIEARTGPHGREVRIAFDPTRDWAAQTSFAQFLNNVSEWLGPVSTSRVRPACVVGAICPVDARWTELTLIAEDHGATLPAVSLDAGGPFRPMRAGLFRSGDGALVAINPDPQERADTKSPTLAAPARMADVATGWVWLLASAALALAVEGFVAWRRRIAPHGLLVSRCVLLVAIAAALLRAPGAHLAIVDRTAMVIGASNEVFAPGPQETPPGLISRVERPAVIAVADAPRFSSDEGEAQKIDAHSTPQTSPLADALRVASASLPQANETRIVMAGRLDAPGAQSVMAASLRAQGHKVDVLSAPRLPAGEVVMADVEAPQTVFAGESFTLVGRIRAAQVGEAQLRITINGDQIAEQIVKLNDGDNPVEFAIPKAREGDALYEMSISATGDSIAANNHNGVRVFGRVAPRILIMSAGAAGKELAEGLVQQGFAPKVVVPTGAPWLIEDWLQYDAYVMMDVPAIALNSIQQQLIVDAVSRHGRPLLMFGGAHSFGPGGYLETALDKLSPLSSRVPKPSPEAAVVYVIDRSGSMSQAVGDVDRLTIAKQATISAMNLLNPQSKVSVIAFDTEARVVAPLQPVTNIVGIRSGIAQMTPGGGTELFPAMNLAFDQLRNAESSIKHVIVFTDGLIPPAPFDPLIEQMTAAGISISTVSVGTGGGDNVLRGISRLGRGAFHATNDFRALPSIIAQETMLLSDSAVEERPASPAWSGERPGFLNGLPETLPDIEGYVLTTGKPDAQVSLKIATADGGDAPLLASWQFGSGKVMAMTTQINGPWTKQWMALPAYQSLWAQVIPHFLSGGEATGLNLRATRRRDGIAIIAQALDKARKPRAAAALAQIRPLVENSGEAAPMNVALSETQPGLYEGFAPVMAPGDYAISLQDGDKIAATSVHIAYPASLAFEDDGAALLAKATGGRVMDAQDFRLRTASPEWFVAPNWLFWALAAFVGFCAELLWRYRSALWRRRMF